MARGYSKKMRKVFTLVYVVRDGEILLGRKGRKLGKGFWNGFGGGVEEGESVLAAAIRETHEEVGITPLQLKKIGEIVFVYPDKPLGANEHEVHVFIASDFAGRVRQTSEMETPTWFSASEIPYAEMWPSDAAWLPYALAGKAFMGRIEFDIDKQVVVSNIQEMNPVDN